MQRKDPLLGFRFLLEIESIASGGFMRVKNLSREVKHESFREGGVNDYEHKLFSCVSYPAVLLERGFALEDLWVWALEAADGRVKRRNIQVRLQNAAGETSWSWQIEQAFPVKWSASDLDAGEAQVVMESLELAHHGLRKAG